jgi:putative pyoverdin transport system ATP-binding/permease protein
MKLLRLLFRESTLSPWFVLFIASLSGLSNSLLLAVINMATQQSARNSQLFNIILFIVVLSSYLLFQRYLLILTINEIERILHRVRLRIVNKITDAELLPLEQLGRSLIYASVTKEMQTISSASIGMVMLAQSGLLIIFTLVYVGFLSLVALMLFIVFFSVGTLFYLLKMAQFSRQIHEGLTFENELFEALTHLLNGFKEVKMSERRSADLVEHIGAISTSAKDVKANAMVAVSVASAFAGSAFYVLAGIVVFILPRIGEHYSRISTDLATGVLFLAGPLGYLVGSVQIFGTANAAAENLEDLEAALDRHVRPASKRKARRLAVRKRPFVEIVFDRVQFEYLSKDRQVNFRLGPIDLSISQGETIFITGGNGSGKSTFLRLLTCLYFPTKGAVKLDGRRLSEANAATYRELISVIFYDYHLFDQLYGLRDIDQQYVEQLLEMLKLKGVTRLVHSRFEPLDLSSGQKRRLALLVSYLENKPINVFDEWAAEQDPEFRRYFYTSILPQLKANGKTIIAVTHDDQYHNMGYVDRLIKFEEGRIVSDS